MVLIASMIATASIILRVTSRLNPDVVTGSGSPTNELMRHMLFVILLTQIFDVDPELYLVLIFLLNSITMGAPFKLKFLIRGLAKTATAVIFVNVALGATWLMPTVTPLIAATFFTTYLYSFVAGGRKWLKER